MRGPRPPPSTIYKDSKNIEPTLFIGAKIKKYTLSNKPSGTRLSGSPLPVLSAKTPKT